jgi:hypothetical protein
MSALYVNKTKMDSASLVSVIHKISPSLAAYHYLRSCKAQLSSDSKPRCSRCGYLLNPTTSHTRLVRLSKTPRKKQRSSPRSPIVHALKKTCTTCGHVNNTLLHPVNHNFPIRCGNVTTAPQRSSLPSDHVSYEVTPRTPGTDQFVLPDPPPVSTHLHPPLHSSPSLPPPANARPQLPTKPTKSRPKHKGGLQEMLTRNKERQREAADRGSAGLATLLHSL